MNKKRLFKFALFALVCCILGLSFDALADEPKKVSIFSTTISNYMRERADACWFCTVFDSVYDAINEMVGTLFNGLAKSFLSLMGGGILFLLLFKVGKMLVQLQDVDLMQFLNDLFKPLGRAIIATAILGVTVADGNKSIFYLLSGPFIETSLRVSEEIMDISLGEVTGLGEVKYLKTDDSGNSVSEAKLGKIDWGEINTHYENENSTPPAKALGKANKELMGEWLKKVSSSFTVGRAMGWTFMQIGIEGDNFFSKGFPVALAGTTLWIGFWVIYIFFPIRLLNAFVRLAFVLSLMPLWIILWVFPPTQQYTKKAWEMFLSACLLFIVLSFMTALALLLVDNVVPANLVNSETGESITRDAFFNMLIAGQDEEAKKYTVFGSNLILNCIAFTLLGWQLFEKAETLANSFIAGGGNIQLNVGNQTIATVAKEGKVALSMGKAGANVGIWAGKKVGGRIIRATRNRFQGSGGGGNEGAGSGDTPPPPPNNPNPTGGSAMPGPQGPKGEKGKQGERGPQGAPAEQNANNTGATDVRDQVMPQATNVRETVAPPTVARPTVQGVSGDSSAHSTAQGQPAVQQQGTQSAENNAQETLASLSPERKRAVQGLANEGGKATQLQNLSQDVAFIENALGMKRDDFDRTMKGHAWLTDGKKMQSFADDLYSYKDKPTLTEVATNRMLRDTYLSSAATMDTAKEISQRAGAGTTQKIPHMLSNELQSLASQVSAAETVKKLPKG